MGNRGRNRKRLLAGCLVGLPCLLAAAGAGPLRAPLLASVSMAGGVPDGASTAAAVTPDGRFVAFASGATDLVAEDADGAVTDVFLRDRREGTTRIVSLGSTGAPAAGNNPSVSDDGRFVVFQSYAPLLVPGDVKAFSDVFVRDVVAGTTTLVSVGTDGSPGDGHSFLYGSSISGDGRRVVFFSRATNLVEGDDNGTYDVFVRDLREGTTVRASVDSDGNQSSGGSMDPSISANGRFVVFQSGASDLVEGDANGQIDVFLHDLRTGATERVSVDSAGGEAADGGSYDPVVSRDGRTVAFWSEATGLVAGDGNGAPDVFVRDRRRGRTVRASVSTAGAEGNGSSAVPCLHPAGRFVVFYTLASNLAEDDTNGTYDVALRDLRRGTTRILSRDGTGAIGEDYSYSFGSSLSSNGRWLAFTSEASNLAPGGESGEHYNVFVVRTR